MPTAITVASANIVNGTIVNADINASAAIVDTKLATISTAGKVSNSATTATSANTASTIVARDASGNFAAGTITGTATDCSRSVLAGDGITGGGALSANRTITLGTPGTLTGTTANAVTSTSHTHAITVNLAAIAGTTAGPTITSSAGTNVVIPSAAAGAAGIVTTGAQTFAGVKTFSSTIAGSINGNAATATTLATARTIGGVSFNGSANINLPGVNTTGNQNTTGNAATVTTNANLTGDVTSVGNATSIAAGVIVNADINVSAAVAGTKISPNFGAQAVRTTGTVSSTGYIFNSVASAGLYSTNANILSLPTSSVDRLTVMSDGSVRIAQSSTNTPGLNNTTTGFAVESSSGAFFASRSTGASLFLNVNANSNIVEFRRSGSFVGAIVVDTTSTQYVTSSDYRLKENVVPLKGAIDRIGQLQPLRFNFLVDPDKTVDGFIAHEAQSVVPESVTGVKDELDADGNPVYQGIDQSKLIPLLTAALQEAIAKINTLESRLDALKA